jgi:hypothetical protein
MTLGVFYGAQITVLYRFEMVVIFAFLVGTKMFERLAVKTNNT